MSDGKTPLHRAVGQSLGDERQLAETTKGARLGGRPDAERRRPRYSAEKSPPDRAGGKPAGGGPRRDLRAEYLTTFGRKV